MVINIKMLPVLASIPGSNVSAQKILTNQHFHDGQDRALHRVQFERRMDSLEYQDN